MFHRLNKVDWTQLLKETSKKKIVCRRCDIKIFITRKDIIYDHDAQMYSLLPSNFNKIPLGWMNCVNCKVVYGVRTTMNLKIMRNATKVMLYNKTETSLITIE